MSISTHVLDTASGRPAGGIPVTLEFQTGENRWTLLNSGSTDSDGRMKNLLPDGAVPKKGVYRLTFDTAGNFYPQVMVIFTLQDPAQHYHVPLLLSPYGYTTYRGS